jgi:hypothetical protein
MGADALTRTKHPVDSFTMLGSAGIDTQVVGTLSDLRVKKADGSAAIYTTAAELDWVAPLGSSLGGRAEPNPEAARSVGSLGGDAINPLFVPMVMGGAQSFSSKGAKLPDGTELEQTQGHSALGVEDPGLGEAPAGRGYLDPGTESLRNTGYTSIGWAKEVVGGLRPTG